MCTAISFKTNNHYFGRNLDLEYSYNETVKQRWSTSERRTIWADTKN